MHTEQHTHKERREEEVESERLWGREEREERPLDWPLPSICSSSLLMDARARIGFGQNQEHCDSPTWVARAQILRLSSAVFLNVLSRKHPGLPFISPYVLLAWQTAKSTGYNVSLSSSLEYDQCYSWLVKMSSRTLEAYNAYGSVADC